MIYSHAICLFQTFDRLVMTMLDLLVATNKQIDYSG